MAKKEKRSGSGFFMGLILGMAIGATVVWVMTPQPGELEARKSAKVPAGATDSPTDDDEAATGATSANGASANGPTVMDLVMAAVDRVRARFGEAVALGREAYEQGQAEVMQRFNEARSAE